MTSPMSRLTASSNGTNPKSNHQKSCTMDDQIIKDITAEIDTAFTPEGAAEIGMLTVKTANQTVEDAAMRPDPDQLYHELCLRKRLTVDAAARMEHLYFQRQDGRRCPRNLHLRSCKETPSRYADAHRQLRWRPGFRGSILHPASLPLPRCLIRERLYDQ